MRLLFMFFTLSCLAYSQATFQEQAQRLQNIFGYLIDFRAAAAPTVFDKTTLEVVLDLTPQPSIDTRVGIKEEDVEPPEVVPKLRGRIHLKNGLMLGGAYAPGLDFEGYKAEFVAVELGWRKSFGAWSGGIRGSYIDGDVEGPITEVDLDDLFTFTNMGVDVSVARTWNAWTGYGFVGINDIETELDVAIDGVHLVNDDDAVYGGLGIQWASKRWAFTLEQHATDDYLQHLIVSVAFRF